MNAVTWPFIYDGIPILYYGKIFLFMSPLLYTDPIICAGQEQGYQGGDDPNNREA